jgi:hypothetical protein
MANSGTVLNCSGNNSNIGIQVTGASCPVIGSLSFANKTSAIDLGAGGSTQQGVIVGNTLYGSASKRGTGIAAPTTNKQFGIINNIITGFTTGISHADSGADVLYLDNNDFYNNTTDVTNCAKGASDIALDPTFTSVTERSGTTATTTAGNHLVDSTATFSTWGVTTSDFVCIVSGTGPTAGVYQIASVDSETQITTTQTLTANATANKVWTILKGNNFAIGTNLKAAGYPGVFPGALTTGYTDIGAVQRQEVASGGSGGGTYAYTYA